MQRREQEEQRAKLITLRRLELQSTTKKPPINEAQHTLTQLTHKHFKRYKLIQLVSEFQGGSESFSVLIQKLKDYRFRNHKASSLNSSENRYCRPLRELL